MLAVSLLLAQCERGAAGHLSFPLTSRFTGTAERGSCSCRWGCRPKSFNPCCPPADLATKYGVEEHHAQSGRPKLSLSIANFLATYAFVFYERVPRRS